MTQNIKLEQWLADQGLGRYIDVFTANDIDLRALVYLTDADLKELGISLGHRRILLGEIGKMNTAALAESSDAQLSTENDAERRHLTVVFCDLVGSTVISQKMDPEQMRDLLRLYQNAVTSSVRQYSGYVARFIGDGVLCYFGWPQAYEDQAERAVRAAMEAVAKVKEINFPPIGEVSVRVGMDTGLVVVGDLVGEELSDLKSVVGDTPNIAARLQTIAKEDEIVISADTRNLLGSSFQLESLGQLSLKGFDHTREAWKVNGIVETFSRFEAAHGKILVDLVGRQHELGLLRERWNLAKDGEGQVVVLSGEAGIGKSRLARDFKESISGEVRFNLTYQCSPHHTNSAFYPVIQRLHKALNLRSTDSVDDKLDKIEKSLKLWGSDTTTAPPLFAALMSVPGEGRYGPLELTPQQLRQRTIEGMIEQILSLSKKRSVSMLVEDGHWIDPSMKDFINELIPRIAHHRIFVLVTYRPEDIPDWSHHQHVTSVTLNRLSRKHAAEIAHTIGGQELMEAMIEKIVLRADGVPLYIEELTKTVLESFSEEPSPVSAALIPVTLQSSLVARLDRLGDAKDIAQIGSVIGRDFSYELVAAIATKPRTEVSECLERLTNSGLVFRRGLPPDTTYTFKHALIQDAAYDTILLSRRKRLHSRIVELLEQQKENGKPVDAGSLAHHAYQGEVWDKAHIYLKDAGRQAMDRAAVREAVALFKQALEAGAQQPESESSLEQDIDLRFDLRNALWSIGEFEQILTVLGEAESLAVKLNDSVRNGWISVFSSASQWQLGRTDQAQASAHKALELNRKSEDRSLQIGALFYQGCATITSGDCVEAEKLFGAICDMLGGEADFDRCGLPFLPAVISRSWMVWSLAERGEFNHARELGEQALEIANKVGHPFNIAHTYYDLGYYFYTKGETAQAVDALEKAHGIITEWSLTYLSPFISGFLGHAHTLNGNHDRAAEMLELGMKGYETIGLGLFRSLVNCYYSRSLMENGMYENALTQGRTALTLAIARGEKGHQAYCLQNLGKLMLHPELEDKNAAKKYLDEAGSISEQLGMHPLAKACKATSI